MAGPDSSYSSFEIHICWNVDSDAKIEPPIHTEYLRSGGAMILIFIVDGANATQQRERERERETTIVKIQSNQSNQSQSILPVNSFCILSAMPGNIVEPPDSTVLP